MSFWTNVFGAIEVIAPAETKAEVAYLVDTVLTNLPAISDNGMEISVHISDKSYRSCNYNRWDQQSDVGVSNRFRNMSRNHKYYDRFDHAVITVSGRLPDMTYKETLAAVTMFLNRLSKRLFVENILLRVSSQYSDEEYVFNNSKFDWSYNYDHNDPWVKKYLHTTSDFYRIKSEQEGGENIG